jgi:hypothetical protein
MAISAKESTPFEQRLADQRERQRLRAGQHGERAQAHRDPEGHADDQQGDQAEDGQDDGVHRHSSNIALPA